MDTATSDRIEKEIVLRAPRSRVWKAISDAQQFGEWFQVDMSGVKFEAGKPVQGKMTYPGYEGQPFNMEIDRIEPEDLFSFKWHPYGIDQNYDYSQEPMTLVEFRLQEVDGGTKLTITESGFDKVPLSRRAEAFRMNDGGWQMQIENIRKHVEGN
ncbi:MAG: SRPBCC family protein [Chloroflexota bacterium]